jgi:hypothetical protein
VSTRQNPLAKFESFMKRMVEDPFARMFPTKLEPISLGRRLERAMDENVMVQSEGRKLAPSVYDIVVSREDHQQLFANPQTTRLLERDWQKQLLDYALRRHYTLKYDLVVRTRFDQKLAKGEVRIEVDMIDPNAGGMATQQFSADQVAALQAHLLAQSQSSPANMPSASSNQASMPLGGTFPVGASVPNNPVMPPAPAPVAPTIPPARLTIRLPNAPQQVFHITKAVVNIGRQLSNDIIVEDKRVSRYHAQIKYQPDGQFAIFDLGSTNGITINGTPHMRQHLLHPGDRFIIGSYDFYFERR